MGQGEAGGGGDGIACLNLFFVVVALYRMGS